MIEILSVIGTMHFFEVRFKLDLKANGGNNADGQTTIINGAHSLIRHMVIKSAGKIVYDTDHLYLVTFAENHWNIQTIMLVV